MMVFGPLGIDLDGQIVLKSKLYHTQFFLIVKTKFKNRFKTLFSQEFATIACKNKKLHNFYSTYPNGMNKIFLLREKI